MKIVLSLIAGILVGGVAVWFYGTKQGKSAVRSTGKHIRNAARSPRDAVKGDLKGLDLRSEEIKDELDPPGQVVGGKGRGAGVAIADATADARVTTAIKAKLLADRDLSS